MNPVVGLDVSKGESQVQAFLGKGKPYRKLYPSKFIRIN
jgi:transposase